MRTFHARAWIPHCCARVEPGGGALARAGPAAGVQVAVWLRLAVLLPLLPVVYADREPDGARNLRARLAAALLRILASPLVHAPPAGPPGGAGQEGDGQAAAAAAAAAAAGESLFERLLSVLHALLGGAWAAWLRGDQARAQELLLTCRAWLHRAGQLPCCVRHAACVASTQAQRSEFLMCGPCQGRSARGLRPLSAVLTGAAGLGGVRARPSRAPAQQSANGA